MLKWYKKLLIAALPMSLILVANWASANEANCLSLKQIRTELNALGDNLVQIEGLYDLSATDLESTLDKTTLAEYLSSSIKPQTVDRRDVLHTDVVACQPGNQIPVLAESPWTVVSASKNQLTLTRPSGIDQQTMRFIRKSPGKYEAYITVRNTDPSEKEHIWDYCSVHSEDPRTYKLSDFSYTNVLITGPRGSISDTLPISDHLYRLYLKALLNKPVPECPMPQMRSTDQIPKFSDAGNDPEDGSSETQSPDSGSTN